VLWLPVLLSSLLGLLGLSVLWGALLASLLAGLLVLRFSSSFGVALAVYHSISVG